MTRNCFVPLCRSGNKNTVMKNREAGIKNPSLFRAQSETQLQLWERAIQRADKRLSRTHPVCELHFQESDIERHFITRMPNGDEHWIPRDIPKLKADAVPSIFPDFPQHLECILPSERNGNDNKPDPLERMGKPGENAFNFDMKTVKMPSEYWGYCVVGNKIDFSCWEKDFSAINKRIILHDDMHFEVYFFDKKIDVSSWSSVYNSSDVCKLLQEVEDLCLSETLIKSILLRKKNVAKQVQSERMGHSRQRNHQHKAVIRKNLVENKKAHLLSTKISELKARCAAIKMQAVEKVIADLPKSQQVTVQEYLRAAKLKNKTIGDIYGCMNVCML